MDSSARGLVMNDFPRQKLRELVARYGRSLCDDPLRCEGLLRDLCGQNQREIFALSQAVQDGIPSELLSSSGQLPVEVLVSRFSKRLEDRCGMNSDLARWTIESWMLALGLASDDQFKHSTPPITPLPVAKPPVTTGPALSQSTHLTSSIGKSKRRWFPYVLLLFILIALAIGHRSFKRDLFESRAVKLVKTGHLQNYPQRTVGEAIDSFFDSPKWESGTSADGETKGKTFVNAKGKIKFMGKDVDAVLQLIVNEEDTTFNVHALEFNNIPQNQFMMVALLTKMYETSEPKREKNTQPVPAQDGGYRGVDEDINTEKALLAVYGNFNPVDKTALWKNIGPKEKLKSTGFSGTDGLVTAAFDEHYTEGGKEKYIVVTKTVPAEQDFTCHACGPIVGVISFVRNTGKWVIESESKFVTTSGAWGELPEVKLIRLGTDKHGLRFDGSDMAQGYQTDYIFIVANFTNKFKEIFTLTTREDATGACESDKQNADCNWKYSTTVDLVGRGGADFYDIRTVKTGTHKEEENGKISAVNETAIYTFKRNKVEYVLATKTPQPVSTPEVKNQRTVSAKADLTATSPPVAPLSSQSVKYPQGKHSTQPDTSDKERAKKLYELATEENRALQWDSCLAMKAFTRAKLMVTERYFDLEDPKTGKNPVRNMVTQCIPAKNKGSKVSAAENLAKGIDTPANIHKALMGSPALRKNIMDRRFNHLGVGCYDYICVELFASF